jgi:ribosomal 50S subunit-recycling heat shock protein
MRLDKFLKVSRVIKRRTVAKEISANGRVTVNDRPAKPSTEIHPDDLIGIRFGSHITRIRVLQVIEHVRKEESAMMFEVLEDPANITI